MMRAGALSLAMLSGAFPGFACDLPADGVPLTAQTEAELTGAMVFQLLPVPVSGPFTAEVVFCSEPSALVSDIQVDARMPAHQHGMNYFPVVAPLGRNRFEVRKLVFHMPGAWEITVSATVDSKVTHFTADVLAQ